MKKRFRFNSDSRGADEIKDLTIPIDFRNRNTELLLLFSIISPCVKGELKKKIKSKDTYIVKNRYRILLRIDLPSWHLRSRRIFVRNLRKRRKRTTFLKLLQIQ